MKIGKLGKDVWAWCIYDWANSAFALTVMTGFFPILFKSYWNTDVDATVSTARLGIGTGVAGLCVAVLSPLLGAFADAGRAKKKLLAVFVLLGSTMTASLFFVPSGFWLAALSVFILADIGFSSASLLYDSLLTDVSRPEEMDFISSLGYSIGYLGSGLLFVVNVLITLFPGVLGLDKAGAARVSFLIVALWWAGFTLPLLLLVKERGRSALKGMEIVQDSLRRLSITGRKILSSPPLWLFLAAYWFYIDGVFTFIRMAVDYGMAIGVSATDLMIALIVVQFVAFPAALGFGVLARLWGTEKAILLGIGIYTMVSFFGALLLRSAPHFIILAAITGMAQGGIQALSRSYFGKIIPADESGEYFGFYNLVGKASVILGPLTVGMVALITRHIGLSSEASSRLGMSSVTVFFLCGGVLLLIANRVRKRAVHGSPVPPQVSQIL